MASFINMNKNDYKKNALEFWDYYIDLYGDQPNFKTYIDNQAVATSQDNVLDKFEFYKMGWSLLGEDVSNAQEVYEALSELQVDDFSYLNTEEDMIDWNASALKSAQDPNFDLYNPNFDERQEEIHNWLDPKRNTINNKIEKEQIVEKPKEDLKLQFIDNLGIILMSINIIYFIIESLYHIFSDEIAVFYLWGHYEDVYKLSGALLVVSLFGLNHYYSRSDRLKQVIDDLWLITLKLKTFLIELLELKTIQNLLLGVVGILFFTLIISYFFGSIYLMIKYWYVVVAVVIILLIYILYDEIKTRFKKK